MLKQLSFVVVAAAVAVACQPPEESAEQAHARMQSESAAVQPLIEARVAEFVAAWNGGDAAGVAAVYTPDAAVMPPDRPGVAGRDAIRELNAGDMAMLPGAQLAIDVVSVTANGPLAVDRGTWTLTMPGPDGAAMEMTGKYLAVWHQIDGQWYMAEDIWNNDAPMPAM